MVGRRRPAFSEYRPKPVLLPESFCVPLRRRMCGLSRFHRPMICDCCVGNICPLPAVYHPPASFVKKHFPLRKRFHHRKFYTFTVAFFPSGWYNVCKPIQKRSTCSSPTTAAIYPPRDVEHLRLPPQHRAGRRRRHSGAGPERKALNRPQKGP